MNTNLIIPVILTMGIYSLLYKENKFYRFIEHLFVGTTMGYWIVVALRSLNATGVKKLAAGNYIYIIPFILGAFLFARFYNKEYGWLNRFAIALIVGTTIGVSLRGIPEVIFIKQLSATLSPLLGAGSMMANINNIIIFLAFVTSILYFTFTFNVKGKYGASIEKVRQTGRYFLMIYFGALFGNAVIHRSSLLISRLQFIVFDFLQL